MRPATILGTVAVAIAIGTLLYVRAGQLLRDEGGATGCSGRGAQPHAPPARRGRAGRPILLQLGVSSQLGNLRYRQGDGSLVPDFRTVRFDVDPRLYVAFNVGAVRITPFAAFRFTGYEQGLDGSSRGATRGARASAPTCRSDAGSATSST